MLVLHKPVSYSQKLGATVAGKNAVEGQSLELGVELFAKLR